MSYLIVQPLAEVERSATGRPADLLVPLLLEFARCRNGNLLANAFSGEKSAVCRFVE